MSSPKGLTLVLSLALVPPACSALTIYAGLQPWQGLLRPAIIPFVLLWALAVRYLTVPYFTHPLRHLPQPPRSQESFLYGYVTALQQMPRGQAITDWIDNIPNNGLLFLRGILQGFPAVIITSPEALQEALVTKSYDFEKVGVDRSFLRKFLGQGLIVAEGAEHKFQRKHLQPAFSGKQINSLVSVFWAKSRDLAGVVSGQLHRVDDASPSLPKRSGVVDLDPLSSRVTLDIIGLACLGRDFNAIHQSEDKIVEQYEKILAPTAAGTARIMMVIVTAFMPLWLARRFPFSKQIRDASDGRYWLRVLCRQLMEGKRRETETQSEKHSDIISSLIRTGEFNDDQLVDQIQTFLAAGHETTSNALCWIMYLLATHPEKQARLRSELQAHFGYQTPQNVTEADLEKFPYLSAVISEQLRLWPVVPMTGREASRDTTLLGEFIPKGTIIITSPWGINRSKKFWGETATQFVPERWLDDAGHERPFAGKGAFSVITFLHGPRSCIGQSFTRAELKCLVIALIMKFQVDMADPREVVEIGGLITIKPKDGLKLRMTELQYA